MLERSLAKTDRSCVKRMHERGSFDRDTVNKILDAQPMCSVGYVVDGTPYVTPTMQWREGNHVYWHGSSASRALKKSANKEVCLTVFVLDGFVMARSGMHHSANYRSAMLFGSAEVVPGDEKEKRLTNFVNGLWPGRAEILRPNTAQELKATTILRMEIAEGSAKIRSGQPVDDEEDYDLPIWAGVIPVRTSALPAIPDPRNRDGVDTPEHIDGFEMPTSVGEPWRM